MSFLAFEVNVLGRLEYEAVAMPFARRTELGVALKRRGKRVTANDVLQSAWTRCVASIQNNSERLTEDDVNAVLEDAYVPGNSLQNPALKNWFSEMDAWWFENVRRNLDKLESPHLFATAASIAMNVGNYALSFDEKTRELRRPLSLVYKQLWETVPAPINNSQNNTCQNKTSNEFLAESFVDLMFLHLPTGRSAYEKNDRWSEEWLRGAGDFWPELDAAQSGKLGAAAETKSQFLRALDETLSIASNIKHWAIAHVEGGFVTTQDIVEAVNKIRRVEAVYTKDFTELTGSKAVIITA